VVVSSVTATAVIRARMDVALAVRFRSTSGSRAELVETVLAASAISQSASRASKQNGMRSRI
jgi:hypothetical protein